MTPVRTKCLVLSSGIEHPLASSHSRIPASHRFSFLLLWGIERVASGAVMTSTRFVVLIRNFVWTVRERRASLLYMLSAHACLSLIKKVKKYMEFRLIDLGVTLVLNASIQSHKTRKACHI